VPPHVFPPDRGAIIMIVMTAPQPAPRSTRRVKAARNDPCPCGSGRKYKHCCGGQRSTEQANRAPAAHETPRAAPSIGPVTDAGRFLEAFSPLQKAIRQGQSVPAAVARWRNYEPWLGELRELLPPGFA
jgi:hypothetical protein